MVETLEGLRSRYRMRDFQELDYVSIGHQLLRVKLTALYKQEDYELHISSWFQGFDTVLNRRSHLEAWNRRLLLPPFSPQFRKSILLQEEKNTLMLCLSQKPGCIEATEINEVCFIPESMPDRYIHTYISYMYL